jgi:hypothetical protein
MKKNLILEIERINFLMNNTLLIEQPGAFVQFIEALVKKSPQSIKNLETLIKKVRVVGEKLSDEDISRVIRELKESGGLTDDEIESLTKTFRKDADIKKILQDSDNFLDDFRRLTKKTEVPKSLESLANIGELTDSQIDSVINNTINSIFKDTTSNVYQLYNSVNNVFGPYIDNFIKNKYLISNSEDFYTLIDNELNKSIKADVDAGRITEEQGKEFFEKISTEIRTNSAIKNKIDDMIDEGLVLGTKSEYKKIKFGDTPIDIHFSDIIQWDVKPTDIRDLSTGKPKKKPKSDFFEDDPVQIGMKGQYLNWFQRTYWSVIEPWSRVWRTQFELGLEDLAGKTLQQYEKEFLEASNDAFTRYKVEGMSPKTVSQVRKMVQKFQKVPRVSEFYIPSSGNPIYEKAWDDFVKYGKKNLQDKPKELEKFNEFVKTLEQKNLGHRNASFSDLIEGTKKVDSSNKSFDDLSGGEQMQKEFNDLVASASGKRLLESMKKGLWAGVFRIYTHAWTGFFTTPRKFSLALTKESKRSVMLAAQGNKVVSKVMRTRVATGEYIEKLFLAKIVLPVVIGTFEMIFEGFTTAGTGLKIKERGDDYDSGLMNWFANYAVYDILNGIQVGTYIQDMFEKMKGVQKNVEEWEIWWNRTEATIPGIGDSLLLFIPYLLAKYGSFAGKGQTPTEFKEELDSILEPRKISEPGAGGTSNSVANLKAEFDLNVSRRDPKVSIGTIQKVIDRLRWDYTRVDGKPISSEPNLFWVEDLIENKQYSIKQNPNWNVLSDEQQYLWENAPNNKENTLNHLAKAFENNYKRKVKEFCQKQKTEEIEVSSKKLCDSIETQNPLGDVQESKKYINKNLIMENTPRTKFGEDNFKHWKDTFVFKAEDEKNPGQFKQVKINMEDVMDRINHYRKKYDEDDAFVRAVLDTHDNVVKVMYTKDLANISESALPRGLALVLREDRGELEIFSVSRPANGNWFLVKGDYTPSQMANMDLEKKEPEDKESTKMSKTEDDLKKKEEESIILLKRNEKEGLIDLPRKVKQKLKEKISKGWTTEEPPSYLMDFYTTSQINSVFNDPIEIYKLESSPSYFATLVKYSARVTPKRGFCRSLQMASRGEELNERQRKTINHILTRCKSKLAGKFGIASF